MSAVSASEMRSVRIHEFGGSEVMTIESTAIPQPEKGEVLIKVHAAGGNPVDWKIREGYLAEVLPHTLPLTLGWDFSGEVVAIGNGVDNWKVGDAVYSRPDLSKNGAYSEYIVVSSDEIAAKPKTLSWQKSAAVPLVTLTAWQALKDIGKLKSGNRVLIHAGAGGVGIAAIQLAKQADAYVITTSSSKNINFLKSLGADEVIDYTQDDFTALSELDIVFDTMGGEVLDKSWKTLKKGGHLVSIVEAPSKELASKYSVDADFCFVQANAGQLTEIAELIDAGDIKVEVDSVFRLEDVAQAHKKSETGHVRGKIILQIQPEQ